MRRLVMKKLSTWSALVLAFVCAASALAQTPSVVATVADAKFGPAPPMLPPGAQLAVLSGNPMGTGAYAVRVRFPANYAIPAHSHPTDENVVVSAGSVTFGMGDKLSKTEKGNKTLNVGGYALMPAGDESLRVRRSEGSGHRPLRTGTGRVQVRQPGRRPEERQARGEVGHRSSSVWRALVAARTVGERVIGRRSPRAGTSPAPTFGGRIKSRSVWASLVAARTGASANA
jgi:hypothetical protein